MDRKQRLFFLKNETWTLKNIYESVSYFFQYIAEKLKLKKVSIEIRFCERVCAGHKNKITR